MEDNIKIYAGNILLSNYTYDWDTFRMQFFDDWKVEITEAAEEFSFQFKIGDVNVACMLVPAVRQDAFGMGANNYAWPECEAVIAKHEGHIEVGIMDCQNPLQRHILFTMVASSMMKQDNVLGLYQYPTVHRPEDYIAGAEVMLKEDMPIQFWVYIGMHKNEEGLWSCYTYGMEDFNKMEMEIVDSERDLFSIYRFMLSVVTYVITNDDTLESGESLGISEDEKYEVTESPAFAYEGRSLKINY